MVRLGGHGHTRGRQDSGHQRPRGPGRAVEDLDGHAHAGRPIAVVGDAGDQHPLGAPFGHHPGIGPHQGGVDSAVAADELGVGPHRRGHLGQRRIVGLRGGGRARDHPGQAGQRQSPRRRPAAVHARTARRLVGQARQAPAHRLLHRRLGGQSSGGVAVGGDAGQQHQRVRARAVVGQGRARPALGGHGRRAGQRGLVQPGQGQHVGRLDLLVVAAAVAGRADGQRDLIQLHADAARRAGPGAAGQHIQAGGGLGGLDRRAGIHRLGHTAHTGDQPAGGVGDGQHGPMDGLHDAVTDHLDRPRPLGAGQ